MRRRLTDFLDFAWRRISDASVLAWLFPTAWGNAVAAAALLATAALGIITGTPIFLWIPAALLAAAFVLALILLWCAIRDPNFGRPLQKSLSALEDADLKRQASKWIAHEFARLPIQVAMFFGSITHDHYPTSDVDVIVGLMSLSDRKIARTVRKLKGKIAADFQRTFGHKLHITFFCAGEEEKRSQFLVKAGRHEIIELHT